MFICRERKTEMERTAVLCVYINGNVSRVILKYSIKNRETRGTPIYSKTEPFINHGSA